MGLDGELKSVLSRLDLKVQAKEQKTLSISTDFGRITHIQTDLFEVLHAHRIRVQLMYVLKEQFVSINPHTPQVNPDHPIVREARKHGDTIFVMTTLYQTERCNIEVSFSEKSAEVASGSAEASVGTTPLVGATAGASVDDSKSTVKGIYGSSLLSLTGMVGMRLFLYDVIVFGLLTLLSLHNVVR